MERWVVPGVGSGATFLGALFLLNMPFALAVGVGAAAYVGLTLAVGEKKPALPALPGLDGMTQEDINRIVRDGHVKVASLRSLAREARDKNVGTKILAICALADRIFDNLRDDPRDIRVAKRFLDYYLDATVFIVERYLDLSLRDSNSPELRALMPKFTDLLNTIHTTFEKQYKNLLRNDVLALDTEMTVLKQMMETEGP